ncbi:hypothetical protein E3Q23_02010 [Wallemia mellicola]|nr:hypothetical protein E3Q23_02010 [Wallemia mellicola]
MASMDLDMSLDDIVKKKKTSGAGFKRRGSAKPRGGFRKQHGHSKPAEYRSSTSFSKRPTTNRPREPRQPPAGERENQIKMTNVHYEISEEMLGVSSLVILISDLFGLQELTKLRIRYDKSGRSTGEAIVAFESSEDADRAIEEFNGKTAKDQIINVEPYGYFTVDPPSNAGASSGDNAGSLLSRLGSKVNPGPVPTGPRAQISRRSVKQSKPKKAGFNKPKPAPKDADSLDKELDEFMKKPTENDNTEDTEMS